MPIISSYFSFLLFIFFEPLRCPCCFPILLVCVHFFHVQDFFRLLLFLVLLGFPYFFALCLLLSLLFPPLCCTCWHLMSNMKIGTTAGKYSMCIVLGPFHKGTRAKRKSATNPPQWVHIPLLCFFCLVCFLSLLLFLCCRIYPVGGSTKTNPEHGGTRVLADDLLGESQVTLYIYILLHILGVISIFYVEETQK